MSAVVALLDRAMPLTHTYDEFEESILNGVFEDQPTRIRHKTPRNTALMQGCRSYESQTPCKFLFGRSMILGCGLGVSSLAS